MFVYVKTFTTKTFTMTKMGELKRIVSADKIYKAKDSVVVMITPALIVVKNVAMSGVEKATLFSKASYMKAMAFADTLVNKMNKKYEEQQEKKKRRINNSPRRRQRRKRRRRRPVVQKMAADGGLKRRKKKNAAFEPCAHAHIHTHII